MRVIKKLHIFSNVPTHKVIRGNEDTYELTSNRAKKFKIEHNSSFSRSSDIRKLKQNFIKNGRNTEMIPGQ